jgi:hypothetical protein
MPSDNESLTPGEAKIQQLREELPPALFRMAVRLLLCGHGASATTNWILLQPEPDKLTEWRFETLQPYVSVLNARVQGWLSYPVRQLALP